MPNKNVSAHRSLDELEEFYIVVVAILAILAASMFSMHLGVINTTGAVGEFAAEKVTAM